MKISYYFEDIVCDVLDGGYIEPHYRRARCNVDYEYEVEIGYDDYLEYNTPHGFSSWSKEEQENFTKELEAKWDENEESIKFDLECNNDFYDFMKNKYRDDAEFQCRRENR